MYFAGAQKNVVYLKAEKSNDTLKLFSSKSSDITSSQNSLVIHILHCLFSYKVLPTHILFQYPEQWGCISVKIIIENINAFICV